MWATMNKHHECMKLLLEETKIIDNVKGTALTVAVENGDIEAI